MACVPGSQYLIQGGGNCPAGSGMPYNPGGDANPNANVPAITPAYGTTTYTLTPPAVDISIGFIPQSAIAAMEALGASSGTGAAAAGAIATLGPLFGLAGVGITTSLAVGAPAPDEYPTSALEAQTAPAATPPLSPPGASVAASGETPPNWWDLAQGGVAPLGPLPISGGSLATTADIVDWLTRLGNISELAGPDYAGTPATTVGPAGLSQSGDAITGVPNIGTVEIQAPRPVRAPLVVADPSLSPIGIPEPGLAPMPSPATAPRRSPGPTPRVIANPLASPIVGPAPGQAPFHVIGPAPARTPIEIPLPIAQPVTTITPVQARTPGVTPLRTPAFTPNHLLDPTTWTDPNPGLSNASKQKQCSKPDDKKKKKKRQSRSVCHSGTYIERKSGLTKHPRRVVACQ